MTQGRWQRRVVQGVVGVVVGLVIAEGMMWWRDDGAFPHVNFYVSDPQLGVRLAPWSRERLAFGGNPPTSIATNGDGFRTHATTDGAWPPPGDSDVLVVGDSQVFGLGVEVADTFSSRLAMHSGRTVLNAGVPTYGPHEYAAVVDEVTKTRAVKRVIFVVNLANDLFELSHPNIERHVVWDGWAVRAETAPKELPTGSLRRWLFSQSHLIFAARAASHGSMRARRRDPEQIDLDLIARPSSSTPSEGHWRDLLATSAAVLPRPAADPSATTAAVIAARAQARTHLDEVERELRNALPEDALPEFYGENEDFISQVTAFAERQGRPDDILVGDYAESGRSVLETATALLAAATMKKKALEAIESKAQAAGDSRLLALLEKHHAAQRALDAAVSGHHDDAEATGRSRLFSVLSAVKRRCDERGARLIVVALPLDVMVSAEEWKKYDEKPLDMTATRVLIDEVLRDAEAVGAVGVDVSAALAAAEPGAFLQRDLHMTAKGHDAVARALVPVLDAVPAVIRPRPGLPAGRSYLPSPQEWAEVTESTVKGSTDAGCETKQIREWLKVACLKKARRTPNGVEVLRGGEGDAHALFAQQTAVVVAPVLRGKQVQVRFFWREHTQDLTIDWPATAEQPTLAFGQAMPATTTNHGALSSELQGALCEILGGTLYCGSMYGALDDGCDPTPTTPPGERGFCSPPVTGTAPSDIYNYLSRRDCRQLCLHGQPEALPRCAPTPAGPTAPMFATQRCRLLCDVDHPCADDHVCVPWQGSGACLPRAAVSP